MGSYEIHFFGGGGGGGNTLIASEKLATVAYPLPIN